MLVNLNDVLLFWRKNSLKKLLRLKEEEVNLNYTLYRDHTIGSPAEQGTINYYSYFTSGAAVSVVEVDCLTGDHEVNLGDLLTYNKQVIIDLYFVFIIRF